jgi:putative N-acetylmannosamine-6-phosphate epimerase
VDRVVLIQLEHAIRAKADLVTALQGTSRNDPDFAELLARVHASGVLSVAEISAAINLSRSRLYEILAASRGE